MHEDISGAAAEFILDFGLKKRQESTDYADYTERKSEDLNTIYLKLLRFRSSNLCNLRNLWILFLFFNPKSKIQNRVDPV